MITTTLDGAMTSSLTPDEFKTYAPLTAGIPEPRFASPLQEEFDRPWNEAEKKARKRLADVQGTIDGALLDPESFFKANPYDNPLATDMEAEKKNVLVQAYLQHANQGQRLPMGADGIDIMRARVAYEKFDGRGADDPLAFHAEIVKEAQGRKDEKELQNMVSLESAKAAVASIVAPTAIISEWTGVREKVKTAKGYKPSNDPDLHSRFYEQRDDLVEKMAPYAKPLEDVFTAFRNKTGVRNAAYDAYQAMPDAKTRQDFLTALRVASEALPEPEKKELWANLKQQTGRDIAAFAETAATTDYYDSFIQMGLAEDVSPQREARDKEDRKLSDFVADVVKTEQTSFDKIDWLTKEGSWARVAESALYGAPGAFATTAIAAIPYVGQAAFAASAHENAYQEFRGRFEEAGDSPEEASEKSRSLAPFVALPELLLEKLQIKAFAGKLPIFEKMMQSFAGRLKSTAAVGTARTVIGAIEEGGVEQLQGMLPDLVQKSAFALGLDVKDVDWQNGKTGVLDGFWKDSVQNILVMLPISIMLGGKGVIADRSRIQALQEATDTQLLALGATPESISSLRMADGMGAQVAAVEAMRTTLDPQGEIAKTANEKLEQESADQRAAIESAKASGMMPDIVGNARDGYRVLDGETKAEVGTSPDMAGAMRMATAHSAAMDDLHADYISDLLTAGENALAVARDENATTSAEIGTRYTEATAAAENPASIDQFAKQATDRERIDGGNGDVTLSAIGRNVAETRGLVRTFTNRLFQGASVRTVIHETGHGMLRRAWNDGSLTRDETLEVVQSVNRVMMERSAEGTEQGRRIKRGAWKGASLELFDQAAYDEADTDGKDRMLHEAVAELLEADVMRTRKRDVREKVVQMKGDVVTRGVFSAARLALKNLHPKLAGKFLALRNAVRGVVGLSVPRALAMKKAIREGTLQEADIDLFMDKLTGRNFQYEHNNLVRSEQANIVGQEAYDVADENAPFSLEPVGAGVRKITDAPEVVRIETDPFSEVPAGASLNAFGKSWNAWERENRQEWRKTVAVEEGPIQISQKTHNEMRVVKDGEDARLHYQAATVLPELLERSKLAAVENEAKGKPGIQEVHRRYAWADFPDGKRRNVLLTVFRWDGNTAKNTDTAYAEEVMLEVENEVATGSSSAEPREGQTAATRGDDETLARFNAGIKQEHRWVESSPLSLAPSAYVDSMSVNVTARIKDPKVKAGMFRRMLEKLGDLKRDRNEFGIAFGKGYERESIESYRKSDLQKKANRIKRDRYRELKTGTNDIEAKAQAEKEAKEWFDKHMAKREEDYSPRQRLLRSLAMLDAILSVIPPEVRGRVGGYTQLAKLGTDEARLKFLNERIEKIDKEIERYLGAEYTKMLNKLFERAKPAKGKPGEKPRGKAGASVHALFDTLREARTWNAKKTQDHHDGLMADIATGMVSDGRGGMRPMTPEEEAHMTLEANLVLQIGDWKNADAARKSAAVANATQVFENGYYKLKFEKLLQKEDRDIRRSKLQNDTGSAETLAARQARYEKDNGIKGDSKKEGLLDKGKRGLAAFAGKARKIAWYAKSFADTVEGLFGRHSVEGQRLVDLERNAAFKNEDSNQADWDAVNDFFMQLAAYRNKPSVWDSVKSFAKNVGTNAEFDGWNIRHEMTEKTVTATAPLVGGKLRFSQFEAVDIILTWRRGQGQRHMLGTKDENANYAGKWHYNQTFVDEVESQLSSDGRQWMAWLSNQYREEWANTNPTFEKLQGISLPRDPDYYPISAKPLNDKGADMLDPVTGLAMTPGSGSPGFLKAIAPGAIAEPDFQDSLQKFLTHRRQLNHWLSYAPVMAEVSPLLGNRDMMNHLEARGGKEGANTLRDWISYFTQGGYRDASASNAYNQFIQQGMSRLSGAILVGRMSVLAVQTIQLGAAQAEMSVAEYVPRIAKLLFNARSGWPMWMAALKSDYIQRRIQQMPPSLRAHHEQLMKAPPTRIRYWQSRLGGAISGADGLFTAGTYAIILDQKTAKLKAEFPGLSDTEINDAAHAEATRLTEKLAQPTRAGTRSLMEVQAGTAMRSIWNFSSESRQKVMMGAIRLTSSEYTLAEKARTAFVVWGVGGMMLSILRSAVRDIKDDGEDDEWTLRDIFDKKNWSLKRLALETATAPLQGLAFFGDIVNATTYMASGQYRSDRGLLSAIPIAVDSSIKIWDSEDVGEVLGHAEKFFTGAAFFSDNASAAASAAHIARDLFGIIENFDGQTK